ncbi:MAG: hypothetical protein ISS34_00605 [Candidatus Omnitrophica bacterium]|nr:hypothetical protein [Candidatus Omnitrophota bacterium]
MKTKITVIIIILTILFGLLIGVWYINKYVLPVKIKGLVTNFLEEKTGRSVSIGSINYLPISQFYLNDITIYDNTPSSNPLIILNELSFNISLWPLLKERDIKARVGLKDLTHNSTKLSGVVYISLRKSEAAEQRLFFKGLDGTVKFANFSVEAPGLPTEIENISGEVNLDKETIRLDDTFLKYKNTVYNIEGSITDLDKDSPQGRLSLTSPMLKSEGNFILKYDYLKIEKIGGTFLGSSFEIMGEIKGLTDPLINIYGEASLDLADLKKALPRSGYIQDSLNPAGLCHAAVFFNGNLSEIEASEASVKLKSNKVFLHGLALDDLNLDLRLKDGRLNTERFTLKPYLGHLAVIISAELDKKDIPYSVSFELRDLNLAKFSADMNFGQEKMKGFISSKFFLNGKAASTETLRGNGWVKVIDGHLWELPLLGGAAELLKLSGLDSVTFQEAFGNFIVGQRKISTEDLTFFSEKVNMTLMGSVDFDQNIDLLMKTHIIQDLVEGTSDASQIANLLISEAGNYMGRVKITGTLKEPQYKMSSAPVKEIFKGEFKEVEGILKDIFR